MSTTPPLPDTRTYNRKLLDQVRALLVGKALDDVSMYKIGTRELTKIPVADLLKWEATLERRVWRERHHGRHAPNATIIFGAAAGKEPRFSALRLWIGRVLIALLSDPMDRVPAPVRPLHSVEYHERAGRD